MKLPLFLAVLMIVGTVCFAQNSPEIHCKHFYAGYPYGTPSSNDLIIREISALSSNDSTKFADWVAYWLDKDIIIGPNRSRYWAPDPWLDETETLEPNPDDGDDKGVWAENGTDRGHQAPLASFDGSPFWYETNYLSNIDMLWEIDDTQEGAIDYD